MTCSSEADNAQIVAALAAGDSATARAIADRLDAERASRVALLRPRPIPAPRDSSED